MLAPRSLVLVLLVASTACARDTDRPTHPIGFPGNTGGSTASGAGAGNQATPAATEPVRENVIPPGAVFPFNANANTTGIPGATNANNTPIPGATNANNTPIPGATSANNTPIPGATNANNTPIPGGGTTIPPVSPLLRGAVPANANINTGTGSGPGFTASGIAPSGPRIEPAMTTAGDAGTVAPSGPRVETLPQASTPTTRP